MNKIIHENVRRNQNIKDLIADQNGTHIIQYTNGKTRVVTNNSQRELTEQTHKKQCDLNYILRNYQKTGTIEHVRKNQGRYDDISPMDFTEAMHTVSEARNMFNELPAYIRKRVGGEPEKFLEFVQNPDNREELQRLGMLAGNDGVNSKGEQVPSPTENSSETAPQAATNETA